MRKRSGALHSTSSEEFLKLAEDQQRNIQDIYSHPSRRNVEQDASQDDRKRKNHPIYDMRPDIDLQKNDSSVQEEQTQSEIFSMNSSEIDGEADSLTEFEENRTYNHQSIDIMLITQFDAPYLKQIYNLDSFNSSDYTQKDKMLDLVIDTVKIEGGKQVAFKLWMHNITSSKAQSGHNQIIEQIHYARCSQFIFLYQDGDTESERQINLSYEKAKRIKANKFHATFVGVTPSSHHNIEQQFRENKRSSVNSRVKYFVTDSQKLTNLLREIMRSTNQISNVSHKDTDIKRGNDGCYWEWEVPPSLAKAQSPQNHSNAQNQQNFDSNSRKIEPKILLELHFGQQWNILVRQRQKQIQQQEGYSNVGVLSSNGSQKQAVSTDFSEQEKKKMLRNTSGNMKVKGSKSQDLGQERTPKHPRSLSYHFHQENMFSDYDKITYPFTHEIMFHSKV